MAHGLLARNRVFVLDVDRHSEGLLHLLVDFLDIYLLHRRLSQHGALPTRRHSRRYNLVAMSIKPAAALIDVDGAHFNGLVTPKILLGRLIIELLVL